jgi:hypothetical protein
MNVWLRAKRQHREVYFLKLIERRWGVERILKPGDGFSPLSRRDRPQPGHILFQLRCEKGTYNYIRRNIKRGYSILNSFLLRVTSPIYLSLRASGIE